MCMLILPCDSGSTSQISCAPWRQTAMLGGAEGSGTQWSSHRTDGNILITNINHVREHREDTRKDLEGLKNCHRLQDNLSPKRQLRPPSLGAAGNTCGAGLCKKLNILCDKCLNVPEKFRCPGGVLTSSPSSCSLKTSGLCYSFLCLLKQEPQSLQEAAERSLVLAVAAVVPTRAASNPLHHHPSGRKWHTHLYPPTAPSLGLPIFFSHLSAFLRHNLHTMNSLISSVQFEF